MLRGPCEERSPRPKQGEVDCLGPRRDERDLGPLGSYRVGGQVTRAVEGGSGGPSLRMRARRVSRGQSAQSVGNFGEDRRRPGVVQVDARRANRGCGLAGGSAL